MIAHYATLFAAWGVVQLYIHFEDDLLLGTPIVLAAAYQKVWGDHRA